MDITTIREILGDATIVNELIQYMTSDQLEEFSEHLVKMYDLDYED